MAVSVHLWDQTLPGTRKDAGVLEVDSLTTSARELIRMRLAYVPRKVFPGFGETERLLNAPPKPSDPEADLARAFLAFEKNAFLIFVDGMQVTDLDERLDLRAESQVEFIKLLPLAGGSR
jgi:hypothetical protein